MDRKNNDLVSELAGLGTVEFVRVMQLREFEEHLRAGKPVVMRETKQTLGLSVKFSYNKKYTFELGSTTYNHKAHYDALRDRDFYSATFGVNF